MKVHFLDLGALREAGAASGLLVGLCLGGGGYLIQFNSYLLSIQEMPRAVKGGAFGAIRASRARPLLLEFLAPPHF